MGSRWGRISIGQNPSLSDSRKIYAIYESFPSSLIQIDPDSETLDTLLGPVVTGTTSTGPASWEEGGVGIDGVQYIATHTPYTPGAHYWDDVNVWLRFRIHSGDLSTASTAVDTTSKFLKSSIRSGSNVIAAGNGKIYAFVGTEWQAYTAGFGTVHAMKALKIVEVEVEGTVTRTFDFPDPPDWFTGAMAAYSPWYEYPGEDSSSIPSMCITPDGTTLYGVVMKPQPTWGEDTWSQCIFKCDVATGEITEFISDLTADPGFWGDHQAFMTANWPDETYQDNWQLYEAYAMTCADNGDLLIADRNCIVRVNSSGDIVQMLIPQNAPYSPPDELYATTALNPYDGFIGIVAKGTKVYACAEGEVYIDSGGGLPAQSYDYVDGDTHHWLIAFDMPNPATAPISLFSTIGFPRHMLEERPYVIWAG